MKRMLMDLQRHWLTDHQQSREKLLVEMTEKVITYFIFFCLISFSFIKNSYLINKKFEQIY